MGEALIIQKKEGFSATIEVSYPSGTCTVTGEGQSYTHTGGGIYVFTVKKKGTYTVSGVDGTLDDSKTVEITELGENIMLLLNYDVIAFANGAYQDIGSMTGMSLSGGNLVLTCTSTSTALFGKISSSDIAINVDKLSTLRVNMRWVNNNKTNGDYRRGAVGLTKSRYTSYSWSNSDSPSIWAASKVVNNYSSSTYQIFDSVVNIDVSKLSGNYYITAYTTSSSGGNYSENTVLTLRDIRLLV